MLAIFCELLAQVNKLSFSSYAHTTNHRVGRTILVPLSATDITTYKKRDTHTIFSLHSNQELNSIKQKKMNRYSATWAHWRQTHRCGWFFWCSLIAILLSQFFFERRLHEHFETIDVIWCEIKGIFCCWSKIFTLTKLGQFFQIAPVFISTIDDRHDWNEIRCRANCVRVGTIGEPIVLLWSDLCHNSFSIKP